MTYEKSIPLGSPNTAVNSAVADAGASYKLNSDRSTAVDTRNEWLPMSTCPLGVKVQLLNPGGIAVYGTFNGRDPQWQGWHPVPRRPRTQPDPQ